MLSLLSGLALRYLKWRYPLPRKDAVQTPPITFPIFVYAHRGGNLERSAVSGERYIENTLPAFRNALRVGADLLELDVQITRDAKVVVFHDNDLGRMCGEAYRGKCVADFTAAELPPLLRHPGAMYPPPQKTAPVSSGSSLDDLQQVFMSPAEGDPALGAAAASAVQGKRVTSSSWQPPPCPTQPGQPSLAAPAAPAVPKAPTEPELSDSDWVRIPLLEEVLREFPDTPLQVDLKAVSLPMVAEVHRLLLAHRGPRQAAGGGAAATAAGEGAGGAAGAAARMGEGPAGQGTASQQQAQGVASGSRGGSKSSTSGAGPDAAAEVARDPGQHHTASSTPSARGVLWGSFNHSIQVACYNTDPTIPLFTSAPRALLLLAANARGGGALGCVQLYESAVILPWRPRLGGRQRDWLLPGLFSELKARGVSVVVFGDVNDEAAFAACSAAGAAALCTDAPSRLVAWMRGAPPQQEQRQEGQGQGQG